MNEPIVFISNSQYENDYEIGEIGTLVGFVRGGDDIPYAVVRKRDGLYVTANIGHIKYNG